MKIVPGDYPHLLEWHSSDCISLADACATPRVKKMLRLLAVDFALEAELLRREMRTTAQDLLSRVIEDRLQLDSLSPTHIPKPTALWPTH